jgi:hypothetical protein
VSLGAKPTKEGHNYTLTKQANNDLMLAQTHHTQQWQQRSVQL